MKKASPIFYFCGMSLLGFATNSFGMMEEIKSNQSYTPSKFSFVELEKTSIGNPNFTRGSAPKNAELTYDKKLVAIHGKNLSTFPLSEETYKFIIERVGEVNKRPFVFKTGPQIIFDDEIDLLK